MEDQDTTLMPGKRMKNWDELSIEEKIERTREAVKGLRWELRNLHQLAQAFYEHQHGVDGKSVVSAGLGFYGTEGEGRGRDYF